VREVVLAPLPALERNGGPDLDRRDGQDGQDHPLRAAEAGVEPEEADVLVRDPLEPRISFTIGLFAWPALANTITDTHFVARDRFGRTAVFLARIFHDALLPPTDNIYALGVDEGSAVVVDPDGSATVLNNNGANGAYLIRVSSAAVLLHGKPLPPYTLEVSHIAHDGEKFDLLDKQTPEPWYTITVDGSQKPPYSSDPYHHE